MVTQPARPARGWPTDRTTMEKERDEKEKEKAAAPYTGVIYMAAVPILHGNVGIALFNKSPKLRSQEERGRCPLLLHRKIGR